MSYHYFIHLFLLHSAKVLALYFIVANLCSLILIGLAWRSIYQGRKKEPFTVSSEDWAQISIVVPAHNEETTIVESINSLLLNDYPNLEIIVVDDGSKDETTKRLTESFDLAAIELPRFSKLSPVNPENGYQSVRHPKLKLIRQKNGGKAAALNLGIDFASGVLVCTIDADTLVEKNALHKAASLFYEYPKTLVGVGGTLRISNGSERSKSGVSHGHLPKIGLPLFQILEYIRAFYLGRIGWDSLDATTLLSGAFALFRKSAVVEVGGFDPSSITEDLELTLRLRRRYLPNQKGPRFKIVQDPVAWTQVPDSLSDLRRQRIRWQRGLASSMRKHFSLMLDPNQKWTGMGAMPYLIMFELLGPLFELLGYLVISVGILHGVIDEPTVLYLLAVGVTFALLTTIVTIHFEERYFAHHPSFKRDWIRFLTATILDCLFYRPLLSFFRLQAMFEIFLKPAKWGQHKRASFETKDSDPPDQYAA